MHSYLQLSGIQGLINVISLSISFHIHLKKCSLYICQQLYKLWLQNKNIYIITVMKKAMSVNQLFTQITATHDNLATTVPFISVKQTNIKPMEENSNTGKFSNMLLDYL